MELSDEESIRSYWKIKPGDIVVDVGACIGSWTLPALERGAKHVYCFEPSKEFITTLKQNLEARGWRDRVTIIDKALWHKEEKRTLYELDQSVIENFRRLHYPDEYIVDCIKLDDYPLEGLDWMKIDVEGAELAVLVGAKETLLKYKPNIIVEIHNKVIHTIIPTFKTEDIINWLPPGYEMKKIDEAHYLLSYINHQVTLQSLGMEEASLKSFRFRGKEIKYVNYITPIVSVEYYMQQELELIEKHLDLRSGEVFVDVGCSIGSWSLPALSLGAHVVGVEPLHVYTDMLINNANINGWGKQLTLVLRPLWNADNEYIAFYYGAYNSFEPFLIKTIRLDSLNLSKLNLIKIDVEGHELSVLRGACSTIKKYTPRIILEHHNNISGPIENVMELLPGYIISKKEDGHLFLSPT